MPAEIQLQNVSKIYANSNKETIAVHDVSFTIKPGEFCCIVGPSGCGKTTLINLIAGFIKPSTGTILENGFPIKGPNEDRVVVFQNYGLFPWKTVYGNIEFGLRAKGLPRPERKTIVRRYLEMAKLLDFADSYPADLSGGMQQRLALVRALAVDPQSILLDEPLGALDTQMRHLLQDELALIWQEARLTAIMVTHDMDEAIYLADRLLVLSPSPGRIVADLTIPLPRPRLTDVRLSDDFQNTKRTILEISSFAP